VNLIPQFGSSSIGFDDMSVATSVGTSNSVTILINGPVSMKVLTDSIDEDSNSRATRYQVLDDESQPALNGMQIAENFSYASWSCTTDNGIANTTPASFITAPCDGSSATTNDPTLTYAATILDKWGFAPASYGPTGCGFGNISDYWQWCGNSASYLTVQNPSSGINMGHLYGYSHTNYISINGSALPDGTNLVGTVITPSSNP